MIAQSGRELVDQLDTLFNAATNRLRTAIQAYVLNGTRPDPSSRTDGSFAYPEIRVHYSGEENGPIPLRSFGRLTQAGHYATSVTKPRLFADYLTEQLDLLIADYDVTVEVSAGRQEIPFP